MLITKSQGRAILLRGNRSSIYPSSLQHVIKSREMNELCRKRQFTVMLFFTIHDLRDPLLFNHEFKSLYSVIDHVSARLE